MHTLEGKVQSSRGSSMRSIFMLVVMVGVLVWLRLAVGQTQQGETGVPCSDEVFLTQRSDASGDPTPSEMRKTGVNLPTSFALISPNMKTNQINSNGQVNAIGFDAAQGRIYGLEPTTGRLLLVGYNGSTYYNEDTNTTYLRPVILQNLGIPPKLADVKIGQGYAGYWAGDFRSSFLPKMTVGNETTNQLMGRLYTFNLDGPGDAVDRTHKMYAINPNDITDVIEIDLSGGAGNELGKNMKVNDWAFSPKNGFLYGYDESKDKILKINPKTGNIQDATEEVKNFSPPHMRGWPAAKDHRPPDNGNGTGPARRMGRVDGIEDTYVNQSHGAAWFSADGTFWTYRNGGAVFQVPIRGNGTVDVKGIQEWTAVGSLTNDAAACPGINFDKSVSPNPVQEGSQVTYTYNITNNSSTNTMTANFVDDLSSYTDGRTFIQQANVSPVQNGFSNNGTVSFTNNNKTFSINGLQVPPGSTATIEVKVQTRINFIFNNQVLHNDAFLKDIVLPGLFNPEDRKASTDLTVTPLPGAKPYLKVYGNDVAAGSLFANGSSCIAQKAESRIFAVAGQLGGNGPWIGAGSQLNTFATGPISSFMSAAMHNGDSGNAVPSNGLTFGNSSSPWGGNSPALRCMPDYFNLVKNNGGSQIPGGAQGTKALANGQHQAVYFDGDVIISGNIAYSNNAWTDLSQIPSFFLVARGNIYIRDNVANLDGVYVAWPRFNANGSVNEGTGNIYTCTFGPANGPTVKNSTDPAACNSQLTIRGAFIARKVYFQRTKGDANNSTSNEAPNANIAEVFDFSQETYLAPLHGSLRKGTPYSKYDSIVSLPPIL